MSRDSPTEMADDDRNRFLGDGATGVLSLSAGEEPPHTVPVSYGYDATDEVFYFRLATGPDSAKTELQNRPVTFVTYGEGEDGWQSVVASGRLEDIEEAGVTTEALEGLSRVDIPLIDIFDSPTREVSFEFYRLRPDELTGRVSR